MNDKISVIIPVYNVELYLNKCLQSIIGSTYSNLEIILINDGSPDNCDKLCKEWELKDNRIIYIKKENGGVCSARNLGLDKATGNYIAFVDADDYISPFMYERLYTLMIDNEADLVICGRTRILEDRIVNYKDTGIQIFSGKNVNMQNLSCQFDLNISMNKLYKKTLFKNLRFPLNMTYAEDLFIVPDILSKAQKIVYTSEGLYYYVERKNSASFTLNEKKLLNDICAKQKLLNYLISNHANCSIAFDWLFAAYTNLYNNSNSFRTKIKAWIFYAKFYRIHFKWSICHAKASIFLVLPSLYNWIKRNSILTL